MISGSSQSALGFFAERTLGRRFADVHQAFGFIYFSATDSVDRPIEQISESLWCSFPFWNFVFQTLTLKLFSVSQHCLTVSKCFSVREALTVSHRSPFFAPVEIPSCALTCVIAVIAILALERSRQVRDVVPTEVFARCKLKRPTRRGQIEESERLRWFPLPSHCPQQLPRNSWEMQPRNSH